ncbi:MAG: hypothetical protein V5A57_03055 [Candidatus Paceibacterota bacterium]
MEKVDYNIEFAHIYSDEEIGKEQLKSAEITKDLVEDLEEQGKSYTTCILIDEYHSEYSNFSLDDFLAHFDKKGIPPSYIGYEGQLFDTAESLLKQLPDKVLDSEKMHSELDYVKEIVSLKGDDRAMKLKEVPETKVQEDYTCVFLATAWTLLRLGLVRAQHATQITGLTDPKPFPAENLITVIPEKYKSVEERVAEVIKATEYEKYLDNIEHIYFEADVESRL